MEASYHKHELIFKKPARTSRGENTSHFAYYIRLQDENNTGYGEAAPLKGLSIDDRPDFEQKIILCCQLINDGLPVGALPLEGFPSLQFAFETALSALNFHNPFKIADTSFISGEPIKINGLVWMNSRQEMLEEAFTKVEQGFDCIKFKVGALDFDEECRMLEVFRKRYSAFKVEIRLDANGAFKPEDTLEKLKELARFDIHSIEQPIRPKQYDWMQEICAKKPIAIALDEELIGIDIVEQGQSMLAHIKPQFLILKPTLIGGLKQGDAWINLARQYETGWWATSALESNIGLNAIAQWCTSYNLSLPQGLGTGSLYTNNIASPLIIANGQLIYQQGISWQEPLSLS